MDGAKPDDDDDTARWFRRLPTAIAKLGPAVVVLDHVVKADDGGLWPIGSQRKRAAISGAQYMQTVVRPFARDRAGAAKLVCAKDRHGNYRPGQKVAELTVTPTGTGVYLALNAPAERDDAAPKALRPTTLMERASLVLEGVSVPLSLRAVLSAVRGREEAKTTARGRSRSSETATGGQAGSPRGCAGRPMSRGGRLSATPPARGMRTPRTCWRSASVRETTPRASPTTDVVKGSLRRQAARVPET